MGLVALFKEWQGFCSKGVCGLYLGSVQEFTMPPRIDVSVAKVFRPGRKMGVLCRLTYEVTRLREGMFRWFLVGIEELE